MSEINNIENGIDYSNYFSQESKNSNKSFSNYKKKYKICIEDIYDILSEYQKISSKDDIKGALDAFFTQSYEIKKQKKINNSDIYNYRDSVVIITTITENEIIESSGFFILDYFIIAPSSVLFDSEGNMGKVHITVFNIEEKSQIFECNIIGFDKKFNCCILKIPNFKGKSFLKWGDSKKICSGSKITMIGSNNISENSIFKSVVSSGRHSDIYGNIKGDLILLDRYIPLNIGSPLVTTNGIVGMIIGKIDDQSVALSESSIRKILRGIIRCNIDDKIDPKYEKLLFKNNDIYESKSCSVGINARKVVSSDLIGTKYNILEGYIVTQNYIKNNFIQIGDLVTHLNDRPIGDRIKQIHPSTILSFNNIGDTVKVSYRKESEQYETLYSIDIIVSHINTTI